MYQSEYLGIKFSAFKGIPDQEFYPSFYSIFYEEFGSIAALPDKWVEQKQSIVSFLIAKLKDIGAKTSLSFGAGTGVCEKIILSECPGIDLFAYDYKKPPQKWLIEAGLAGKYFDQTDGKVSEIFSSLDAVFMINVEYNFKDEEFITWIRQIAQLIASGGSILILSSTIYDDHPIFLHFKRLAGSCFLRIANLLGFNLGFRRWGYFRNIEYIKHLCRISLPNSDLSVDWFDACGTPHCLVEIKISGDK